MGKHRADMPSMHNTNALNPQHAKASSCLRSGLAKLRLERFKTEAAAGNTAAQVRQMEHSPDKRFGVLNTAVGDQQATGAKAPMEREEFDDDGEIDEDLSGMDGVWNAAGDMKSI